jgi:hypothetical protein
MDGTHVEPQLLLVASGLPPMSICEVDVSRLASCEC